MVLSASSEVFDVGLRRMQAAVPLRCAAFTVCIPSSVFGLSAVVIFIHCRGAEGRKMGAVGSLFFYPSAMPVLCYY